MVKQTYKQFEKEQKKLAQKQANKVYKDKYKKASKKFEKVTKTTGKAITQSSKMYKYNKKLSDTLLNYSNAFGGQQTQKQSVGRPKGVMKWISPITKRPVPAQQYYKDLRLFNKLQEQRAAQIQQAKQQELAKRGITPQMLQQMEQARQLREQQVIQQQPQIKQIQQNNYPSNAVRPIWRRYNQVRVETDIMGNKREVLVGNDPRNFWN